MNIETIKRVVENLENCTMPNTILNIEVIGYLAFVEMQDGRHLVYCEHNKILCCFVGLIKVIETDRGSIPVFISLQRAAKHVDMVAVSVEAVRVFANRLM